MDFYQQTQSQAPQEARPGFTEQPMNFGQSQAPQSYGQNNNQQSGGYSPQPQQQSGQSYTPTGGGGNNWQNRQNNNGGNNWQNKQGGNGGGGWNRNGGGGNNWKNKGQQRQLTPEELANTKLPKTAVITGNPKAPEQLKPLIAEVANMLRHHGFIIRASSMDGFDRMVLDTVPDAEIHSPWKNFNQTQNEASNFNSEECKEFAKRYLPEWSNIKDSIQAFYSKNVRLVLGKYLKQPCQIVIIWSEDGCEGPTTRTPQSGQAGHISAIAKAMNIPVINLYNPNAVNRLRQFLES